MNITSDWPLQNAGIRFLVPHSMLRRLSHHPLTQGLYLIATGYYPEAMNHHMYRKVHDNHLLIYCTAGKGQVILQERTLAVSAGDLILLPKGVSHEYIADNQHPWSIYWLHYDGTLSEELEKLIQGQAQSYQPQHSIGIHPRVIATFRTLFGLQDSGLNSSMFMNGCHRTQQLLSFLAILTRQHQSREGKTIDLEQIKALMRQHLNSQLSLEQIAAKVQLSKYHFSKRFKNLTGMSPIEYFIRLKMQEACLRLDSSLLPIKSIAMELGYQDPYYFSRIFKKTMGMSPAQYRASQHR